MVGFISLLGDEVGGLFVAPTWHRQGIARALVDHARASRDHLELEVFEANEIGRAFWMTHHQVYLMGFPWNLYLSGTRLPS